MKMTKLAFFFFLKNQLNPSANDFGEKKLGVTYLITPTFEVLYFVELCPIFVGSLDNFAKLDLFMISGQSCTTWV